MEKDVVEHHQGLVPRGARIPVPEDAAEHPIPRQRTAVIALFDVVDKRLELVDHAAPRSLVIGSINVGMPRPLCKTRLSKPQIDVNEIASSARAISAP